MPTTNFRTAPSRQHPLSPWELPSLLLSVHEHRRSTTVQRPKERPHYAAILAFIYRSRYVVASQVQRRFANILKSDRTTRRHLAELQLLGWIDTVLTRSTSPLWPKVYYLTGRGAGKLRRSLAKRGKSATLIRTDRSRTTGHSADHVLHEVLTTEFLLTLRETIDSLKGVDLLKTERRSLARHPSFRVRAGGRWTRLIPDGMFLHRKKGKGMICSFLEIDTGTMRREQIEAKYERYEAWATSTAGRDYLLELYRHHGAKRPAANFRIAFVVCCEPFGDEERRVADLIEWARGNELVAKCIWLATGRSLSTSLLTTEIWTRPESLPTPDLRFAYY